MSTPKALIPVALGTNRDHDLAVAFKAAGADAECVPLTALRSGEVSLADYQLLGVPGGFSYGDDVAAGKILANQVIHHIAEAVTAFVADGKLVLGICNGFQVLVKAGILPGMAGGDELQRIVKTISRFSLFLVGVYDLPYLRRDVFDGPIKTFIGHEVSRSEE